MADGEKTEATPEPAKSWSESPVIRVLDLVPNYTQPEFDRRHRRSVPHSGPVIHHGNISRYSTDTADQDRSRVRFLFNPSDVTVNYSANVWEAPATEQLPGFLGQPSAGAGLTFQFTLMFDRTYELWRSTGLGPAGTDTGNILANVADPGVLADVHALERLVGINSSGVGSSKNMAIIPWPLLFTLGTMLSFTGFMDSMTVSYLHFSHRMVPTRCSVAITGRWLTGIDRLNVGKTDAPIVVLPPGSPPLVNIRPNLAPNLKPNIGDAGNILTGTTRIPVHQLPAFGPPR
jgi:contractile injection system tube protein